MPSRRRSRRKSIAGNITDAQKRIRYLETRPAPSRLASKVVATKNIALRSIETELIADASVTTRTIGESQVTNFSLSTVTDPDGPAVNTENIAPLAVENAQLAGNISDDKLVGMSSSKLIGQVQDSQISGLSTNKLIGTITNPQLAGSITEDKIVSLPTTKLTGTITNAQLEGSITADKIVSLPTTKLTGTITNAQIADLAVSTGKIQNLAVTTEKIRDLAITTSKYAARSIDNQRPALGAILEELITDGAVTENKIRAGAVTRLKIPALEIQDYHIAAVSASKITGTLTVAQVSGLSNALNTASVNGIGISRSFSTNGNYRSLEISINAGTGSNQLAVGNHTHTSVPTHTHVLTMNLINTSGTGGHTHVGQLGDHSHGYTPSGVVGAVQGSTIRIKKDVSNHKLNDPKNILNLKMKRYKYKNSKRGYHDTTNREWMYGYIAEDLQELGVEEVLSYDKDGLPDGINYGLISILTLELIKVQQAETDELKEELKKLKEKIKNA